MSRIVIRPKENTGVDEHSMAFQGHYFDNGSVVMFISDSSDEPNFELDMGGDVPTVDMVSSDNTFRFVDYGVLYSADGYCIDHQSVVPSGYNTCPMCLEERRVAEMEQEMHERRANERMHPTVDAPRF